MPTDIAPNLSAQILWICFLLACLLGYVMRKTNFCTMGAIADAYLMSDFTRLRQWSLAIGLSILGVVILSAFGLMDSSKSIYTGSRLTYLSVLIGSLCFGFGMVLASGCGAKTLVRIGGGNLKSLVVFLVLGLFAYFTIKGFLAVVRVNILDSVFIDLGAPQDLPSIMSKQFGLSRDFLHLYIGVIVGALFIAYAFLKKSFLTLHNLLAGVVVGGVVIAFWLISGYFAHVAEDPNSLEEVFLLTNSGKMESLSFVAPYAYSLDWLMFFSDVSKTLTIGIVALFGVICGSFVHSCINRSFRWESFTNTRDLAHHLLGGALMGFGGVAALGCTIGQGVSGISTLAVSSFLALPGFILGAVLAMRYLESCDQKTPRSA